MTVKTRVAGLMLALSKRIRVEALTTPPVPVKPPKPKPPPVTAKTCTKCRIEKPIEQFNLQKGPASDKRRSECCICTRGMRQKWRESIKRDDPERHRAILGKSRPATRKAIRAIRLKVLDALGGFCQCCGETESCFLAVDHIHNDGKADRALNGRGHAFFRYVLRVGCPKDRYQVLCHNCNCAKAWYGACPHTKAELSLVEMAKAMVPQLEQ